MMEESPSEMKRLIRVAVLSVALVGIVFGVCMYNSHDHLTNVAERMSLQTNEVVESEMILSVKQDLALSGFTEALFCGWTPYGHFFWFEFSGGLDQLHSDAKIPHNEYIVVFVDGKTGAQVQSKGLLGVGTVNANLEADEELNHIQGGADVDKNWGGNDGLMGKMRFGSCASNPKGTFSTGSVYRACGASNSGGLHVSKLDTLCQWTFSNKKDEMFYLYYKKATKCIIAGETPPAAEGPQPSPVGVKEYVKGAYVSKVDADKWCKDQSMKVIQPRSAAENDAATSACGHGANCWLGITRVSTDNAKNNWYYAGTTVKLTYWKWMSGQPDNHPTQGGENCAMLYGSRGVHGQWNDVSCVSGRKEFVVCQK